MARSQQGWGHVGMGSFEHLVQRPLLLPLPRPLSLLATATALLCYCYCDHDCTHCHCYCYHGCPVTAATRGAGRPLLLQWAQQTIVLSKRVRKREIERERERYESRGMEQWKEWEQGARLEGLGQGTEGRMARTPKPKPGGNTEVPEPEQSEPEPEPPSQVTQQMA